MKSNKNPESEPLNITTNLAEALRALRTFPGVGELLADPNSLGSIDARCRDALATYDAMKLQSGYGFLAFEITMTNAKNQTSTIRQERCAVSFEGAADWILGSIQVKLFRMNADGQTADFDGSPVVQCSLRQLLSFLKDYE